jgi:cytochrome P450
VERSRLHRRRLQQDPLSAPHHQGESASQAKCPHHLARIPNFVRPLDTAISRRGTAITASTQAMNRNVHERRPHATGFNPDRWLDNANRGTKSAFSFMMFGQGHRKCIGEVSARTQMECVLAALVDSFAFSSAHKLTTLPLVRKR